MIRIENECVDCGKPCLGNACPYSHVKHYYCDICNEEFDAGDMIDINGEMICPECLHDYLVREGIGTDITE